MTIQEIFQEDDNFCDFLPRNTRLYLPNGKRALFVIENIPTTRTIRVCGIRYRIKLPYIIFLAYVNKTQTGYRCAYIRQFFSTEPISLKTQLCTSPLPNMMDNHHVCLGRTRTTGTKCNSIVDRIIDGYWNSKFNADLEIKYRCESINKFFETWQTSGDFHLKLHSVSPLSYYLQENNHYDEYNYLFKKYHSKIIQIIEEEHAGH